MVDETIDSETPEAEDIADSGENETPANASDENDIENPEAAEESEATTDAEETETTQPESSSTDDH